MERKSVSHNIKQNSQKQSTFHLWYRRQMQKRLIKSDFHCCNSKSLSSKSSQLENDPPMRQQTVCENQSVGTISSGEVTRCLGRLLSWNESTWWGGSFSEKTFLFTELIFNSIYNQNEFQKRTETCIWKWNFGLASEDFWSRTQWIIDENCCDEPA